MSLLLFSMPPFLYAEQSLREAVLRGKISMGGKTSNYCLRVSYQRDSSGGYPADSTTIRSITITLGNNRIIFPQKAFQYFYGAAAPEAPSTSYPDDTHGRFISLV